MWSTSKLLYSGGASAALLLLGCADYLTGQVEEPSGPIQLERLTLFDAKSRKAPIFTDTSLPDCKPVLEKTLDCTTAENRDSRICQVCYLDVFKDMYSLANSPPTPDSGQDMRVVFNKAPLLFDGKELSNDYDPTQDKDTTDPSKAALASAVKLTCADCAGVPPLRRYLVISGSDVSYDPTSIPYGPSLRMVVDATDPRAALEPDSRYTVQVDARIAGRDGAPLMVTAEQSMLLNFKVEPFKVLSVGRSGGSTDTWVYSAKQTGSYTIADQPLDAAVVLKFNAPIYAAGLASVAVTATKNGGSASVAVKLGSNVNKAKSGPPCVQDSQRLLYIYPDAGTWPADATEWTIHIPENSIFDVAQGAAFGQGKHSLGDITITVKPADPMKPQSGYVKVTDAATASQC